MTDSTRHKSRFQKLVTALRNTRVVNTGVLFEYWEIEHLRRLLPHLGVDCVFDVGANVGQYGRMLRERVGYTGRIVSFEPYPEAAGKLAAAAAGDPSWAVREEAIAAEDGSQVFNVMAESQFNSLGVPRHDEVDLFESQNSVTSSIEVRTRSLDSVFAELKAEFGFERPFLKLDTQGFDVTIIEAANASLGEFVGLQSELAVRKIYEQSVDYREALRLYERLGFTLSALVPNNAGHFPVMVETDCIMVRTDLIANV